MDTDKSIDKASGSATPVNPNPGARLVMSPMVQVIAILITTVAMSFLVYRATYGIFRTGDVGPQLITLSPQQLAQFGNSQADVTVSLFVRNFPKFDVLKGEFIADMTLQFEFDARQISIDRLKDFAFENGEILKKSEPLVQLAKDQVIVSYDVRVSFSTAFNYHYFPFDGHRLFMTLIPRGITPAEAFFTAHREGFVLNKALNTSSWVCVGRQVFVGYAQEKLEKKSGAQQALYPRVQFTLDFARDGMRHVMSLLVPMLLIFFVSLFSFTFDPLGFGNVTIINISILAVTALIGYRFVIDNMSPQTGYFMISDRLFLMFMLISCFVFFINIFSARLNKYIKTVITCLLHLAVIGTTLYLTW